MSKKRRLMAGVAMPVLSLSLMWQPVMAAPPVPGAPAVLGESHVIRVQAPVPVVPPEGAPQDAAPEAELPKRAAPAEAPAPEPEPQRKEAPAPEPRAAEPAPEPKAAAPEPKAAAPEPEAPRPRREAAPETPAAEPQAQEKPAERPRREQPAAEQPAERPQRPARPPENNGDAQPGAERPRGERPAGERPAGGRKPAAGEAPAAEKPADAAVPAEKPAAKPAAPAEKPAAPAEKPVVPAEKPAAPAEAPAATAPAAPETVPAARPARPADGSRPAPAPEGVAPAAPAQSGAAPALPGAEPAAPGQASAPAGTPRTPEDIERAKAIAKDPSSATGPVVLPVENGAAILDSAKEYPAPASAQPGQTRDGQPRGPREGGPRGPQGGPQGGPAVAAPAGPPPPPPTTDAEAQALAPGQRPRPPVRMEAATAERGERLDGRPQFERPDGFEARGGPRDDNRVILQLDNRTIVRHDDSRRFYDEGYEPEYQRLRGGRTREIIDRDGGVQIVTIRNRYGDIVQRSRIGEDGREYVLYYAPELMDDNAPKRRWRDPGLDLPPMRLTVPLDDYIIDTSSEPDRDYYEFLEQPPVERVERVYSLDEVRYSARIRDKVRRIDLDTVTFATGSAEIPMNQASSLRKVADAIKEVLERDPSETFLIEGHTDAVGSDDSNLVLSDQRAESVAVVLNTAFGIPPENLATQGYGERYLKVRTDGPAQENRRVTIRRITALVKPVAAK